MSNGLVGCPFMPDLLFNFRLEPIVAWFEATNTWRGCPELTPHNFSCRTALQDARSCPIYFLTSVWSPSLHGLKLQTHGGDAQNSPPLILVSNGLVGCSFMPDLLFNFRLDSIVWCFDTLETWRGCPEFTPTNSRVKRPSRMLVRARFTI